MVDMMPNIQQVYSKWEARNPWTGPGGSTQPSSGTNGHVSTQQYNNMMSSGRQAWRDKFKDQVPLNTQRRATKFRSNRRTDGILSKVDVAGNSVAVFKNAPTVFPTSHTRPFTGRCCDCMPNSKTLFYEDSMKEMGLHNIFLVNTQGPKNNLFVRTFAQSVFALRRTCNFNYPEVSLEVLTSPRLQEAIHKTVEDQGTEGISDKEFQTRIQRQKKRARSMMRRLRSELSNRLIRFTGWFLHKFLGRLLSSILINKGQLEMVKQACHTDLPVIFLPTHRSHLDYILVTFILFNYDLRAPHVAAGDNLLIPVFGMLLRGLGGYFIRRKLDQQGKRDHIYRAILHQYMVEILKLNENMEFFVEGGRTRSGKALYPKGGLLSVMVDAYNEGMIKDAYLVPVSISYEKLMDGSFISEQMGEPKKSESFLRAIHAIWKLLNSRFGSVRVDFAQPFSLKEFMQVMASTGSSSSLSQICSPSPIMMGTPSPMSESPPGLGVMHVSASEVSIHGLDIVVSEQRRQIQSLAEHIVYDQNRIQPAMSSHLVAFIFLTKRRKGVSITQLISDFDWLREEITNHGRDLGFTGQTSDVLTHALKLLGDEMITTRPVSDKAVIMTPGAVENNNTLDNVFLEPVTTLPKVFSLSYFSNVITSVFAIESVVANILYSLIDAEHFLQPDPDITVKISQDRLIERSAWLCQLMRYEYIFHPPCIPVDSALLETIDQLLKYEIIMKEDDMLSYDDKKEVDWARRMNRDYAFADEEDEYDEITQPDTFYVVKLTDRISMEHFAFLRSVVAPVLETYYVTACNLTLLREADMPESDFTKLVHKALKERVTGGIATYAESAGLEALKNAIRGFQHIHVIDCYNVANIRMMTLTTTYKEECGLNDLISSMEYFRV